MSGFRVYATLDQRMPLSGVAAHARRAEALGYDGLNVPDAVHDGLAAAQAALQATTRLEVAISVLVAFPRSPMTVAVAAWDLQEMSGGRFALGLGSQVRGNLIRRYSTSWTAPVPRMREYVHSLRAIFRCWQDGTPLDFQGEHYQFTRMQPFFKPDPIEHPDIPVYTGGIGPLMVALAGEVSDGLMTHPTNTAPRYLREVILPRIARGAKRVGRESAGVELMVGPLTVTGPDADAVAARREETRQLLTFLYTTPAYRPSLALFGWEERGEKLHELSRAGRWDEMAGVIDDEMLARFAPTGRYSEIVGVLREWYADLSDWITFPMPEDRTHDSAVAEVIAALRTGS
jgi:probable F420-dependent oxidoreductase